VKVEVQLFATLAAYLPAGVEGDSVSLELPAGAVVADAIARLRIPPDLDYLRIVNGHDAGASQALEDGDVLSLFPPLAGGE
jgi:molybdopterin converting factor small subunit